jgi:hypothetical protein
MMRSSLSYVVVLVGVLAACGSDDSGSKESSDTGKGNAGKSGANPGDTLACGSETCKRPAELKDEMLCCKDNFVGGCGVKVGAECRALPDVDERCPPPQIMVNVPGASGMKVFGCCTSAGECGIDFGMGCMPRTLACMVVRPDQTDMVMHQKCTGEPLPVPATCGMGGFRIPGAAAGSGG